jgi:DNA-binding NtrC family response regulator/tetratricopeptide (TPR) repeat protein
MAKRASLFPDRYRKIRSLGRGSMGEVFLVRDRAGKTKAELALKVCRAPAGSEARARFQREFLTLAKLTSPALPQVRDFGAGEPDSFWFTYPYVPGDDIFTWSARANPRELYRVARELCEVLTFLHARGVLHLDVKPSNIIVTAGPDGPRPKLIDFGIVRRFEDDDANTLLGTLPYVAPEILRGEDAGPPADFFSLGVTLFECLFRTRPFHSATVEELRREHEKVCPAPPASWAIGSAVELEALIWRLLARDPKNRLPQLDDAGTALDLLLPYVKSASPIGREEPIAALYSAYLACVRGEGATLCLLEGEAGAGKTRALRECQRTIQVAGGRFIGLGGGDLTRVAGDLAAELRGLGAPARGPFQRFQRRLKGLSWRDGLSSELWRQRHQQEKVRYFDALWELLASVLAERPAFIALDDAHRADRLSIELISYLARRLYFGRARPSDARAGAAAAGPPVFFCVSFRSEAVRDSPLGAVLGELSESEYASRIALQPLTEDEVKRLLGSMFGERAVPADVARSMYRLSGGNPLILEETLDALLERGDLTFTPRKRLKLRMRRGRPAVPESADELLRLRLHNLSPRERRLLATLCASPEPLRERAVFALPIPGAAETPAVVRDLAAKRILGVKPAPGGPVVDFSHARLREMLYHDLKGARRRAAHRVLGETLEALGAAPKDLAFHFIAARDPERALRYTRQAEDALKGRGDTETLRRLFEGLLPLLDRKGDAYEETRAALANVLALEGDIRGALRLLAGRRETAETLLQRGLLQVASGERSQAQADLSAARKHFAAAAAREADGRAAGRDYVRASLGLCRLEVEGGTWERGRDLAEETIRLFERLVGARPLQREDRGLLSSLYGSLGSVWNTRGDEAKAIECFRRSYDLVVRDPPGLEKAGLCGNLANIYTARGEYAKAKTFYARALVLARAAGARDLQTLVNANLGLLHLYHWELGKAEDHIGEAITVAQASGSRRYTMFARFCRGILRSRQGNLAEAEEIFRAELKRAKAHHDLYLGMNLSFELAYVLLDRGAAREAIDLCAEGLAWAKETGRSRGIIEGNLALGVIDHAFGDEGHAIEHLETARGIPEARHPHNDAETLLYLGAAEAAAGNAADGLAHISSAVSAFRRLKIRLRVAESRLRQAYAMRRAGEERKAEALARQAWADVRALPAEHRPLLFAFELALLRAYVVVPGLAPGRKELVEIFHDITDGLEAARKVGAERLLWQGLATLGRVHGTMGHEKLAAEYGDAARDALARLASSLPKRFRESLYATPAVRDLRREAGDETKALPHAGTLTAAEHLARLEKSYRALGEENRRLRQEVVEIRRTLAVGRAPPAAAGGGGERRDDTFHGLAGTSAAMHTVFGLVERIAPTELPVLIVGESGTGKDSIARALHALGERRGGPFVSENCSAVPEGLWENEFFGSVKGAFTGAAKDKHGLFRMAHGGTLYLDEIGDLPLELQVKLLRVLEEGRVRPLGGTSYESVDFRLIASTRRDLRREIERGTFREDLFYRLGGMEIRLPPLRERRDDIPVLVDLFARKFAGRGRPARFSRKALDVFMRYEWPGNVRELENEVRRLALLAGEYITADDLALPLRDERAALLRPEAVGHFSLEEARLLLEKEYFRAAWEKCGGSAPEVAKLLGVHERSIYKMRRRLGLEEKGGG